MVFFSLFSYLSTSLALSYLSNTGFLLTATMWFGRFITKDGFAIYMMNMLEKTDVEAKILSSIYKLARNWDVCTGSWPKCQLFFPPSHKTAR